MNAVESCTTLGDLFEKWRAEHRRESQEDYLDYGQATIPKGSFLPDGIIDEALYRSADKRILFITKEGHAYEDSWSAEKCMQKFEAETGDFWLQKIAFALEKNKSVYSKRLIMLCNALCSGDYASADKANLENLKRVAFINLNKRGGFGACRWSTLKQYTRQYRDYIAQEIALIDPQYIVCCGNGVESLLRKCLQSQDPDRYVILSVYHPSYRSVPDIEHLRKLENAVQAAQQV